MPSTTLAAHPAADARDGAALALEAPLPDLRDVACRLERVEVRYGAARPLRGVTIDLIDGETTCLVGMPGSGRSTLARIVAGIDDLTFGRLWVDGAEASRVAADACAARRRGTALLGGARDLIPNLTVRDHVELSLGLDGLGRAEAARRAALAIERAGLGGRGSAHVHRLTGDERARATIAIAIAAEPRLIVADDFGAGQDAPDAARERDLAVVERLAAACADTGSSVLLVSNDPEVAARADRVIALDEGAVYADAYGMTSAGAARLIHELAVFSVLRG